MDQQSFAVKPTALPTLPDDRPPPHNIQAEQALLGAILVTNAAYDRVAEIIQPSHFFDMVHEWIFTECARLIEAGRVADPITLRDVFKDAPPLADGSTVAQYLTRLVANATVPRNAADYARTIVDLSVRRALILISEDLAHTAYEAHAMASPADIIEDAERQLMRVSEARTHRNAVPFASALSSVMTAANKAHETGNVQLGLPTGFVDLDRMLGGGVRRGNLVIVGGRPSMGKTSLALQIAYHHALKVAAEKRKSQVGFFSLEMSEDELALRLLSLVSEIASDDILRGCNGDIDQMGHVNRMANSIRALPLAIDPTGGISVAKIAARARQMKRQGGLDALVVDYLQLVTGSSKRDGNRVQEVTEITTGLKAIAKDLDIPIIALSQLSRKVEDRADKRPQLADLRESGSIEQDADVVLFVYRDEYYVEREKPSDLSKLVEWQDKMRAVAGLAEVIVAKQRHGKVGIVEMAWQGEFARFADLARAA